jgi:hypothetical protein
MACVLVSSLGVAITDLCMRGGGGAGAFGRLLTVDGSGELRSLLPCGAVGGDERVEAAVTDPPPTAPADGKPPVRSSSGRMKSEVKIISETDR